MLIPSSNDKSEGTKLKDVKKYAQGDAENNSNLSPSFSQTEDMIGVKDSYSKVINNTDPNIHNPNTHNVIIQDVNTFIDPSDIITQNKGIEI